MLSDVGPVEYMVVAFPGNRFTGQIAPALAELVESATIRIIDLAFVAKDAEGNIAAFELSDLDPNVQDALERIGASHTGLPLANGPSATGISVGSYGNNSVSNSIVSDNGRYGVEVVGGVNLGVLSNQVSGNDMGIVVREGATEEEFGAYVSAELQDDGEDVSHHDTAMPFWQSYRGLRRWAEKSGAL